MSASADEVAAAVAAVPGVVRLSPGSTVEAATYLAGRRVHGVRLRERSVDVHVVGRLGAVLPELAEDVRRALRPLVPELTISVFVDDVDDPVPAGSAPAEP